MKSLKTDYKLIQAVNLTGRIDDETIEEFTKNMLEARLDVVNAGGELLPEDVLFLVLIQSEGGDLSASMALYDMIKAAPFKTASINVSQCCSGAILPHMACDYRFAFPHSTFMIHDSRTTLGMGMTDRELKDISAWYLKQGDIYRKLLKSLFPGKSMDKWLQTDTYFDAKQAKKVGLVHQITAELPL